MLENHLKEYSPIYVGCAVLVVILLVFENIYSSSFSDCIVQYSNSHSALKAESGVFFGNKIIEQFACSVHYVNFHVGFFSIIAAIMVAIFTFNLVKSTDKLWAAGELQRKDNRRAIFASIVAAKAAKKSAVATENATSVYERILGLEAPFVHPYDMKFEHNATDGRISFSFRNIGRSPATLKNISI